MSILLAIETSQRIGGVALRTQAGNVHVEMLAPKKRHDDDLMPVINRMFATAGLTSRDLNQDGAVAVSIGPGGFTGLRIAVTTAKLLAETTGAKIIAVPSAMVAAGSFNQDDVHSVLVALACKAETCWCTRLRKHDAKWEIAGTPGLCDANSLNLDGVQIVLADEHLPLSIRTHCEQSQIRIVPPEFDPGACLSVAEHLLAAGMVTDPLLLSPLYPREPEAVTLWNKRENQKR